MMTWVLDQHVSHRASSKKSGGLGGSDRHTAMNVGIDPIHLDSGGLGKHEDRGCLKPWGRFGPTAQ